MNRAALTATLEALEVGNNRLATEILFTLLERLNEPEAIQHRAICQGCEQGFEWPGLLDAHYCTAQHRRAA